MEKDATPGPKPVSLPWALRVLQGRNLPHKLGLCERLFSARLASLGVAWVRTAPGPVWKLDLANPTHRWIVYGGYEGPGLWRWLGEPGAAAAAIVDSGANIGQTVLNFAARFPGARILAFEPGRDARAWLEECLAANRFGQVSVRSAGLGAHSGNARLGSGGGDAFTHGSWNQVNATEGEPIEIAALDDELGRAGVPSVDFWKLDVEGYELEALKGAERSIAAGRIRAIYMELGDAREACIAHLRERGFTIWTIADSGRLRPLGERRPWCNALFLAKGHPCAAT